MKKIFLIAIKDVKLAFRDRPALLFILAAPFLLAVGLGLVTGRFSSSTSSGLNDIPVILVNQDHGELGNALVKVFQSEDLNTLVKPVILDDPAQARQQVDQDQSAAAVIIPAGFTESVTSANGTADGNTAVQIEFYRNPTRPNGSGVIQSILNEFLARVQMAQASGTVTATQLIQHGLVSAQEVGAVAQKMAAQVAQADPEQGAVQVKTVVNGGPQPAQMDLMAYLAPGMALMFLMYTVSYGGRTLLAERYQGTLPRLMISPTQAYQVLAGKVFGVYLTGVAQMLILIGASTLFFNLKWGSPLGVLCLVLAAVAGAVGWGMLITSFAKTPGQVSTIGSALMLIFGMLGGSFISLNNMPGWFITLSNITPNAWGIAGFEILATGGSLADLGRVILPLLGMGLGLFLVAAFVFSRRGMEQA